MTKKDYLQPAIKVTESELDVQILADSIYTTGLDGDDLKHDDTPGNIWNEGMSRRQFRQLRAQRMSDLIVPRHP